MASYDVYSSSDLQPILAEMVELRALVEQQQTEMAELRGTRAGRENRSSRSRRAGHASSRRALLKWGGAAAAAAAVTLVASEQGAHAAPTLPANNGDPILAGNNTTASAPTGLSATGFTNPLFVVDNSVFGGDAIKGISTGGNNSILGVNSGGGNGVNGAVGANGNGVIGSAGANGKGVWGQATLSGGVGVEGDGATNGVLGTALTNGNGVMGTANGSVGYGVFGTTDSGYGVIGDSSTGIDLVAGGTHRIWQPTQSAAGAPTSGNYRAGEQLRDHNGDLYLCVADGSPGTWKKVAAIPASAPGGALVFLSQPFRLFDTRPSVPGCPIDPGTPMTSGQITTLQVTGTASTLDSTLVVPSGATGIVGDLLAINVNGNGITGSGAGFLTLQPHRGSPTSNSYLHYYPNQIIHNSVVIGLDSNGKLDVGNYSTSTNVGLDITGYII